ncbi:sulfotransferase 1C3-like [Amphiura filiformis]|uniref:sulfotransferase 1C3-like n=1 Tax=Amphiura filiformis TaxID=82378 RepID=UPI003B21FAB3
MEQVLGKELVEKLIGENGLFLVPNDDYYELDGIPFPTHLVPPSTLEAMKTWQARPDDAFIITYPKAGTTWTQEILSAICNDGDLSKLSLSHTFLRVPFMEAHMFTSTESVVYLQDIKVPETYEIVDKMKSPRTIKSHLPGHLLPPDVMKKKSRVVYVARNPKDLAVSYFHFHNTVPSLHSYSSWEEYFEDFRSGKVYCGPWWDHYLYYWNRRHGPNILFLKYEEMIRDLKSVVIKIMTFLGYTFSDDVIAKIVDHCTFANMKKNPMANPNELIDQQRAVLARKINKSTDEIKEEEKSAQPFMRKGIVGDWMTHFTVAQNEVMEAHIQEKMVGSGLIFDY